MRWRQFLTPVESLDAPKSREYMDELSADAYNLIDVRQPAEYNNGHIPGARLIPIAELTDRLHELDPDKPTIVY
ncbi:MAG: hypothetical protein D3924_15695 [Candidatus Electrothrix sp. AR4]|nr:hypothetical protein [Candidatus Electrothrix sp. AR4]